MQIRSATTPPLYDNLPEAERRQWRDEGYYALEVARRKCTENATSDQTADGFMACMNRETEAYFDRAEYGHAHKIMEAPFRINTAVMTGLSSLARSAHPVGGMLGAVMGVGLAGVSLLEGHQGLKSGDRKLTADAGFNLAIGAALAGGAFQGGAWLLAAPALVVAREAYLRLS
jgi:hypothetical protein